MLFELDYSVSGEIRFIDLKQRAIKDNTPWCLYITSTGLWIKEITLGTNQGEQKTYRKGRTWDGLCPLIHFMLFQMSFSNNSTLDISLSSYQKKKKKKNQKGWENEMRILFTFDKYWLPALGHVLLPRIKHMKWMRKIQCPLQSTTMVCWSYK